MPKEDIPFICPKCWSFLCHVNAVDICGLYFVWCPNSRCRWCKEIKVIS